MGVFNCALFCCTLLYVHSSIAIILMGKRELIALLNLSSWCFLMVERLFLAVPRGCLRFVIVVFPDHTHLLIFRGWGRGQNSFFSEYGQTSNHIKGNNACSNTVANILPVNPSPPDPGGGVKRSKFYFFRTWSCCISNYRELRMQQHDSKYFAHRPPPLNPGVGSKGQIQLFSKHGHVAYPI